MTKMDYLKLLVDEIHSTTVATIGSDGHPQTRIIDKMCIRDRHKAVWYPGAEEMLTALKNRGYHLVILSNCKASYREACLLYTSRCV